MNENNNYKLEQRTLRFSVDVVRHCSRLEQPLLRSITDQLIRSATSIGANYAEANNASSKTDFRSKIYIAKKECQGILMTLQKIVNTLRSAENGERKTQGKLKTGNGK